MKIQYQRSSDLLSVKTWRSPQPKNRIAQIAILNREMYLRRIKS